MSRTIEPPSTAESLDGLGSAPNLGGDVLPDSPAVEETRRPTRFDGRRLLRFNLLTVLLAFLPFTAYFAVRQRFVVSSDELSARRMLEERGVAVTLVPAGPAWMQYAFLQSGEDFQRVDRVSFPPASVGAFEDEDAATVPLTRNDLSPLAKLSRLRAVDLSANVLDDGALEALARCRSLEELTLSQTLVNDAGIENLANAEKLRVVNLERTLTTDRTLELLARLPALEAITLDDSAGARGIAALATSITLRRVDASNTTLFAEDLQPLIGGDVDVSFAEGVELNASGFLQETMRAPSVGISDASGAEDEVFLWWGNAQTVRPPVSIDDDALAAIKNRIVRSRDRKLRFVGYRTPSIERIAELIADSRVVEIELDTVGPPLDYSAMEAVLAKRPAGSEPCLMHGNVSISGRSLVELAGSYLLEKSESNGIAEQTVDETEGGWTIELPGRQVARFIVRDLDESACADLNRAAEKSRLRIRSFEATSLGNSVGYTYYADLLATRSQIFERPAIGWGCILIAQ